MGRLSHFAIHFNVWESVGRNHEHEHELANTEKRGQETEVVDRDMQRKVQLQLSILFPVGYLLEGE